MDLSEFDPVLIDSLNRALSADDAHAVGAALEARPELRALVNAPIAPFDSPPIVHVKSRAMLDVLIDAGADINARSRWWAGSFGLLDSASPELSAYAISRGATLTVHAAARLGWTDDLHRLLDADPSLVDARGGDGQTPLHFAGTVAVAASLVDRGANVNARDVDHESTPAQYMTGDRPEVARFLVSRGAQSDLLLATAIGDVDLVRRHLDADPSSSRMRVDEHWFPKEDSRAGGVIYQWTLGFDASPHDVARKRHRADVLALLVERSPVEVRLIDACWTGDEAEALRLQRDHPGARELSPHDRQLLAHAARNGRTTAVRLMLAAGVPPDVRGQHGATALHWAAFHGNVEMVTEILRFAPPIEAVDRDFGGTPLGWARHGSQHSWCADTGDYEATIATLLAAGARE